MATVAAHRKPIVYTLAAAAVLAVAALVAFLAATPSEPSGAPVTGTYDLDARYAGSCYESGRILGIQDGTPVWVFDEVGHPLANSTLTFKFADAGDRTCHFTFSVPGAKDPAWVQVGDQPKTRISDGLALRSN